MMRAVFVTVLFSACVLGALLLPAQSTQPGRQGGAGGFGQRMDANGDGKISREEFPGPKSFFDQFDADQDNFLSADEREAMRRARQQQGRRPGGGGGAAQELFRALDADADRKISAKEWALLFRPADFKQADREADGHVTPEEWMRFSGQGMAGGGRERPDRGPQVGAPAPKVAAAFMGREATLDFSKIKRHTVMVFGSYT